MNEILIYGDIGWENTARKVEEQLQSFDGEPVKVRVNSGGGDVYEGIGILNALRGYAGEVTTVVESLAASAASFIAVGAGSNVVIRPNAELMIHRAWTFSDGNSDDMKRTIADLDRQDKKIAAIYADRAGGSEDEWLARMGEETWYSADEALNAGLVDFIEDAKAPAAARADAGGQRVFAKFRYPSRTAAPPPAVNSSPSGHHNKENSMSFLEGLAKELGKDKDVVRNALDKFMNEQIEVTSVIELTYPEGTTVVPTGKATVTPEGEVPQGLVFSVGDAPDGWSVEVDEATGVLSVIAPSGAEPDDEVAVTVTAAGNGDPVEFPIAVTVKSAAADDDDPVASSSPASSAAPGGDGLTSIVDSARLSELEADAAYGREARKQASKNEAENLVAQAVADGKIGAAAKPRWVAQMTDPATAEDAKERLSQIRKGLVHRSETGHTLANEDQSSGDDEIINGLIKQFNN